MNDIRLALRQLIKAPAFTLTLLGTAAIMSAVSLVASLIPARRAARVEPMIALRAE